MAQSSQGQTVTFDYESSLGTPAGSAVNVRVRERPTGPVGSSQLVEVPTLHYHPGQTEDPISHEMYREGAVTIPMHLRPGNNASTVPPFLKALESAGCAVSSVTATTLDGYTDKTSWSLTADNADVGQVALIEDTAGVYWPVMVATDSSGDITPTFEIPVASEVGADWSPIHSCSPRYSEVSSTKTLTIDHVIRAAQASNQTQLRWSGCALSDPGGLTLAKGQLIELNPVFHCADSADNDVAISSETFGDGAPVMLGGSNYKVAFADASTSTISESGNLKAIRNADVTLGVTAVPIIGAGGSSDLNGLQGYVLQYTPATVAITMLWDRAYNDDIEGALFQDKYFHVIQGNTTGKPCFGFFCPNMHQTAEPEISADGGFWEVTVTYTATTPGYNSETGLTDNGAAPWTLALGLAP